MAERLMSEMYRNSETLETSTRIRLPTRPVPPPGNARAFENLGTSFGAGPSKKNASGGKTPTSSQAQAQERSQTSKFKPSMTKNSIPSSSNSNMGSQLGKGSAKDKRDAGTRGTTAAKKKPDVVLDSDSSDSEDEIDFLSQGDYDVDDPSTSNVPARRKLPLSQRNTVGKGSQRDEAPMIQKLESSSAVYKTLKFKKKTKDASTQDESSLATPKPRATQGDENIDEGRRLASPVWMKPSAIERKHLQGSASIVLSDDDEHDTPTAIPPPGRGTKTKRPASPPPPPSPSPPRQIEPTRRPARNDNPITALMSRPKPRPRGGPNAAKPPGSSQTKVSPFGPLSAQVKTRKSAESPIRVIPKKKPLGGLRGRSRSRSSSRSSSSSRSRSGSADSSRGRIIKKKKIPNPFPAPSPTAPPPRRTVADFPGATLSPLAGSSKTSGKGAKPPPPASRIPAPFPNLSPPKKSPVKNNFMKLQLARNKDKGKGRAVSPTVDDGTKADSASESESEKKKKRKVSKRQKKLEEFPMNTQMLQSIDSSSPVRPRKRLSEDGSDDEHTSKKSRKARELLLMSPSSHPFDDEGDSISMAPHIDPKTLCPYCDTPLPSTPSPLLLKMLATTKKKSQRDPRPSNPLGLRAPLAIFIAACQRHRFESQILPEAERKGWPKTIEWHRVGARIIKMKALLKALIEDPAADEEAEQEEDPNDWDVVYASKKAKRRAGSIFWMEIMEEVKQKGLRAVSGVRGQFATFEKAQPGYYGEVGSVIIHQTLYNLFPLDEIDPAPISPLTANEFVQRILVPEVALRLIMEDKKLTGDEGIQEALTILRDSSAYGVAMFPEDGGEWDGAKKRNEQDKVDAGDLIVMERARKRRKEIEEEAEREEEAELEEEARKDEEEKERKREAKGKEKRGKAKRKAKDADPMPGSSQTLPTSDPPTSSQLQPPRPRPRPRPAKGASSMNLASSMTFDDDQAPVPRSRSPSRSARTTIATDVSDGTDSDIYASEREPPQRASSVERMRSPSASETRDLRHQTRAASHGVADMHLNSDSDASMKGMVGRGTRARSKSRSTSKFSKKQESMTLRKCTSEADADSDGDVEFVTHDTPVRRPAIVRKQSSAMDIDEEDQATPKPAKEVALHPLERSRIRKLAQQSSGLQVPAAAAPNTIPGRKSSRLARHGTAEKPFDVHTSDSDEGGKANLKKADSYSWLLDSQSSPSY